MFLDVLIFSLSLFFIVLGADVFLKSAEKIGLAMGLSSFIVGVTIVAFGTSFPELFTAISAAFMGATEIITANVVGSNVANILLVVGISAVFGKKLVVSKNLIDVDLPLLAIGTAILISVVYPWNNEEPVINRTESVILLATYLIYLIYTFTHQDEEERPKEVIPSRKERRNHITISKNNQQKPKISIQDIFLLILGALLLTFSAQFLVSSVVSISEQLKIGVGVISILAIAIGTSLPELIVSIKAAIKGNPEVALGNVFGSNVFNSFVVVGLPGLFTNINIDQVTLIIGFPAMIAATFLFVISGISKRIHRWEGLFFLSFYLIFIAKVLDLF